MSEQVRDLFVIVALAAMQGCANDTGELSSELSGGVSFVQAATATPQGVSSTVDVPLPSSQQAGDLNLVAVGWMDVTAPSVAVTDALGNVYVQAGATTHGQGLSQAIYLATNIQSGANSVHVSFSSGVTDADVRVLEYGGLASNQVLDTTVGATGRNKNASSGTFTTTSPNDLVVGLGMTSGAFSTAGSGFTMRINTSPSGGVAEDATAVTAGSYAATAPLTSRARWLMQAIALKAVANSPVPDGGVGGSSITIGETNILASDDGGNANLLLAQKATLAQNATIQSLSFYVTTAAGSLRLGIYDASGAGGTPGALEAQTASFTPVSGWNTVNVTPVALPAGTYWLAYLPSSNSLGFKLDQSTGTFAMVSFAFGAMPSAFPASASLNTGHWSFYATLNTGSAADTQAPSVPTNLAASAVSSSRIDLSWTASTDNVGVTGYRVYRGGSLVATVPNPTYSDTGLAASTTYGYQVSAFDAGGNVSAESASVSATTLAASTTSVGPTGPVGPVATTCSGVNLSPGMSIQNAVNNNANGTVFCLAAGTYAQQHVVPKPGNKFIGAVGATLDGQNTTVRAFDGSASNVVIQNLVIQNYTAGYQNAPVYVINASGWQVLHNEIRYNAGMGIVVRDNVLVQFNYIHHNLQEAYGSDGGVGIIYDSNEFAFNNYTDAFDPGDEAGGGKLWATEGAQVTHNYSHDNHGPGLWDDYNNNNIIYAYNRIEDNQYMGIHHEISYNASIHDNVIKNNGKIGSQCNWLWCAAISIAASGGVNGGMVEIYNNVVTPGSATGNAIGLIQQNRGSGAYGPFWVQNVWVHDNVIDLSQGGHSGAVQDLNDNSIFTSRNNRFDYNTYTLGTTSGPLWWNNNEGGKAFWQGFGLDLHGVFH